MKLEVLRCAGTGLPRVNIANTTVSQVVWEGVSLGAGLWQVHPLNKGCAAAPLTTCLHSHSNSQPCLSCNAGAAAVHILFASKSLQSALPAMPLLWLYSVTGIDVMTTAARSFYPRDSS